MFHQEQHSVTLVSHVALMISTKMIFPFLAKNDNESLF